MLHLKDLKKYIRNKGINLVLAGAEDTESLKALQKAEAEGYIIPHLCGNKANVQKLISKNGLQFKNVKYIDTQDVGEMVRLAALLNINEGFSLLMKGNISTAMLMKVAVKKEIGLLTGNLLSHVAVFELRHYHKLLTITDAAMNIAPDLKHKKGIIENAVNVLLKLGIEKPKVACLSALEKVNPNISSSVDAMELKAMYENGILKNCIIDGPLALDNAISTEAALKKGIKGHVAGDADILLVPDLNSGNILYKSLTYFAVSSCASVLTGAKIPLIISSRTDGEETKYHSILLACAMMNNGM